MRKTKRILLKVEIALRCYVDRPLDASLLVFLAFQDELGKKTSIDFLPRSFLTPKEGETSLEKMRPKDRRSFEDERNVEYELERKIGVSAPELVGLPLDRYHLPDGQSYKEWVKVFKFLAPHYLPGHRDVLNAVASVIAPED